MRVALTTAMVLATGAALAADRDSDTVALELGKMIAYEQVCGLEYRQSAVEEYIDRNVKADDMGFIVFLETVIGGTRYGLDEMSKSSITAQCAQVRRVAKENGFIEG